jgi:uncharacterized protein (DUF1778 family)
MLERRKNQTKQKTTRLDVRASEHQKAVIAKAAELKHTSISDFVLENAYQAASQVIADETNIKMPPEQWEAFCQALDTPPKRIPALVKLLNEPSVFDE